MQKDLTNIMSYLPSFPRIHIFNSGKNPDVNTSFLPDRDREEEENRLR